MLIFRWQRPILFNWREFLVICMDFYICLGVRSMHAKYIQLLTESKPPPAAAAADPRDWRASETPVSPKQLPPLEPSYKSRVWRALQELDAAAAAAAAKGA